MSKYKKHTWVEGETITDTKLNNLEEGVSEALNTLGDINAILDDINGEVV